MMFLEDESRSEPTREETDTPMARIGNRVLPGRYTLGSWTTLEAEDAQRQLSQRVISTQRLVVIRCHYDAGKVYPEHSHLQEQITIVEEGLLEFVIDGRTIPVAEGEMISIWPRVPHETRVGGEGPARALNIFLNEAAKVPGMGNP